MIPGSFPVLLAPASGGYVVEGSGLFDGSSGYLSRTPSSASGNNELVLRFIGKVSSFGTDRYLADTTGSTDTTRFNLQFTTADELQLGFQNIVPF
jgi:hypothetical protein